MPKRDWTPTEQEARLIRAWNDGTSAVALARRIGVRPSSLAARMARLRAHGADVATEADRNVGKRLVKDHARAPKQANPRWVRANFVAGSNSRGSAWRSKRRVEVAISSRPGYTIKDPGVALVYGFRAAMNRPRTPDIEVRDGAGNLLYVIDGETRQRK